jgi:acetoacetate decarboxylase
VKREDVLKQWATPIGAPAFPRGPYRFTNREYLNITYRSDPDALAAVVPEPLLVDEPLVRFEIMKMPDTSGLGSYVECGQAIAVRLGDERGEYLHAMYLDNLPALASGREVGAYPKKLGRATLSIDSDTLLGTLDYGSVRVATATMGYKHRALDEQQARAEVGTPAFMLKLLSSYDRTGLRICELVRMQITDITIKEAWTGPARLQLFEHALAPLADFPVREIVSVSHIRTDLTLGQASLVHDYLAEAAAAGEQS